MGAGGSRNRDRERQQRQQQAAMQQQQQQQQQPPQQQQPGQPGQMPPNQAQQGAQRQRPGPQQGGYPGNYTPSNYQFYVMQNQMYGNNAGWVMGGQRLVPGTQYQSYLFHQTNIRPEIAFLPFPLPRSLPTPPQPPPAPEMQQTTTIRNDVNLKKSSLVAVREGNERFRIKFTLDSTVRCNVYVYFCATETVDEGGNVTFTPAKETPGRPQQFDAALGQTFESQSRSEMLDMSKYSERELTYTANSNQYPIVVKLEATPNGVIPTGASVQCQYTYIALSRPGSAPAGAADGVYPVPELHVVKQRIQVGDTCYELQEIYGIDQSDSKDPNNEGDMGGGECVICMSEPKDTTVLPCRHMCLCGDCAKRLRVQTNKCPICRTTVESLLQIKVSRSDSEGDGKDKDSDNESGHGGGSSGNAAGGGSSRKSEKKDKGSSSTNNGERSRKKKKDKKKETSSSRRTHSSDSS